MTGVGLHLFLDESLPFLVPLGFTIELTQFPDLGDLLVGLALSAEGLVLHVQDLGRNVGTSILIARHCLGCNTGT